MSPVFPLTPLEVSATLECAHEGSEDVTACSVMSAERLRGAMLGLFSPPNNLFLYFFFSPLAPSSSLSVPLAFQPGMGSTCLCNLHKLASEICAYPRVLLSQSELAVQKE